MLHHIDLPLNGQFDSTTAPLFAGWCAAEVDLNGLVLTGPSGEVAYRAVHRPDVEVLFPGHHVMGFMAVLTAAQLEPGDLRVQYRLPGHVLGEVLLHVHPGVRLTIQQSETARQAKRKWCLDHARCPVCRNDRLAIPSPHEIACRHCLTSFPQKTKSLNLLSPGDYSELCPENPSATSSNAYSDEVLQLIATVQANGGKILDCGAGVRPEPTEFVVNLDIADYPFNDVIAVGHSLPFVDGAFDAVLSIAVLEHVRNPFLCAAELIRVLKPGGTVLAQVPFLQPEHGYPNHFYNMTRAGLAELLNGLVIDEHSVPLWGRPIFALHWILRQYSARLSPTASRRFRSMTVDDLLAKEAHVFLAEDIVTELSEEGNWILACMTQVIARKPNSL